jgi:transposase-like protein
VLGLRQGATENTTVVKHVLGDLRERGVDFEVLRLYVLDGGKALHAAVRQTSGKAGIVQRCQVHKIRNVPVVRKKIPALRISTIRAIDCKVMSTLRLRDLPT